MLLPSHKLNNLIPPPKLLFHSLLVVVLLCLLPQATAARCEVYTGTVCAPLYAGADTLVYIEDDAQTQQSLETEMRALFGVFAAVERKKCASYMLALLCNQYLPTCLYDAQTNLAQRRYPCMAFCPASGFVYRQSSNGAPIFYPAPECEPEFDYFFQHEDPTKRFRPQCFEWKINERDPNQSGSNTPYPASNESMLEELKDTCDSRFQEFTTKVANMKDAGLHVDLPTHDCPTLLSPVDRSQYTDDQSPCAIPCPNLTFTHDQYKKQDVVIIVMNSLSVASLFVLLLSWVIFPALRVQSYVLYYITCIAIMTLALFVLIPIAVAQDITIAESLCDTSTTEYHMKGYPVFQGVVLAFCYMSATAWGFVMVVDIFIQVVIGKHFQKQSREFVLKERLYHCFAWFWGAYSVIGGLASRQVGALTTTGGAYALITPSRQQQNDGVFNAGNAFFYIPLVVITAISVILMLVVLYRLIRFRMQARTTGLKLATFVRLFLFIIANTFIICVLLIYTVEITSKRAELNDLTNAFVDCLHQDQVFGGMNCGDAPDHDINYNFLLLSVALFNGMGFISFLIYGTTMDLIYSWLGLVYVVTGISFLKRFEKDYKRNRRSTKATTKTNSTTAGASKTSRSGSAFPSTTHGHDSTTGLGSRLHEDQSRKKRDEDPQSPSTPGKSVFQYANTKNRKSQVRGITSTNTDNIGFHYQDSRNNNLNNNASVEMSNFD